MSAPWTPRPWHCHRNSHYWQFGNDTNGQIGDVCALKFDGGGELDNESEQQATARLIAAAPDLAEVAIWADQNADNQEISHDDFRVEITVRLRAALAKAKGETA